jgi:hypothetical protein
MLLGMTRGTHDWRKYYHIYEIVKKSQDHLEGNMTMTAVVTL